MVTKTKRDDSGGADCPVRRVLAVLGDKWSHVVIYLLATRAQRFSELQRQMPDVSKKMLSQSLTRLAADGLVQRSVSSSSPPQVHYSLTPLGREFLKPVLALYRWGVSHSREIDTVMARRASHNPRK